MTRSLAGISVPPTATTESGAATASTMQSHDGVALHELVGVHDHDPRIASDVDTGVRPVGLGA